MRSASTLRVTLVFERSDGPVDADFTAQDFKKFGARLDILDIEPSDSTFVDQVALYVSNTVQRNLPEFIASKKVTHEQA